MNLKKKTSFLVMLFFLAWSGVYASAEVGDTNPSLKAGAAAELFMQGQQTVTGVVTDNEGIPMPGVTVAVQGTTIGAITNNDGRYALSAPSDAVLVFSFIGFMTEEVILNGRSIVDLMMIPDIMEMDEVVITALGIRRDRKALGYSLQEIGGDVLVEARESNIANALTGRVSGLQVVRSSTGPAGSSKIVLRGYGSLTGDNQPLIVVDGVPIDNFTGASNNDYWNPSTDMGNGLGDINPEDIESMTVLKGASAAALYGSRAGNGVILITTKTGRVREGLGITVSSSLGFQTLFTVPEMQNSFGQGTEGVYDNTSNGSWGPAIAGQTVDNWDGRSVPLSAYDNVKNYFDTGVNQNYNISFQQQINQTSVYASVTKMLDKSMIPGAELDRTNLLTRAVSKFGPGEKWTIDTKMQYVNSTATNRPLVGHNDGNSFRTMYLLPVSMDVRGFNPPLDELGNMVWYGGGQQVNPYWASRYNLNEDSRDRFIIHGSLRYEIADWLNAEVKGGSDMYTTNNETKLYGGSPLSPTGRYSLGKDTHFENNYSALIMAQKDELVGKFGGALTLGGNLMEQQWSSIHSSSGELEVPDLFALNNGVDRPSVSEGFRHKKINSVYGTAQVNYDGYLFVDGTFRNDWSSALHEDNRSFFYPSISTAWVITDMLNKTGNAVPYWFTFGKLRASYAQVGNDLGAYELYNTYWVGKDPNGNTTAGLGDILFNPLVRSELIKSWELGAEARFFQNRLGFDLSWYKSNATRQLINLPMDPTSGYTSRKVNAGDIQNTGMELEVKGNIIRGQGGAFNWDVQVNYSFNKNTIEELVDDVEEYQLGGFDNLRIIAAVGGDYGEIYGTTFLRVEDEESPYYGELLLDANGLPQGNPEAKRLGSQQPDALLGVVNSFSYKGVSLNFMIDGRFGGKMFSGTNLAMQVAGTAEATAPGGQREDMVVDGVIASGDSYVVNDTPVSQQLYWTRITGATGNLGINEANIYDATNIRLRTVQLNYEIPRRLLSDMPLQSARVGFSCNNVWLIKSHLKGVDPESVYATGTNAIGFENTAPPTNRTYLFNITLGF